MTESLDTSRLHFKNTADKLGRNISVSAHNSQLRHLSYGRIRLSPELSSTRFETHGHETALICLAGSCKVRVGETRETLAQYDAIYIPRGSLVEVQTTDRVDLVECSSEVTGDYPLQVVRYPDVVRDPALHFTAGGDAATRELNILIGKNVQAGRLVAGFTRSRPGHWTSWPPHEHADLLEEMYVYFDMPAPAFAVQFVYDNAEAPEFAGIVREGDAVVMPRGYHPNVAIPGHPIHFVWLMAARREVDDRVFGVVNVQPEFRQGGSGLEAGRR